MCPPTPPPRSSSDSKSDAADYSSTTSSVSPHNNNSIDSLKESMPQFPESQQYHGGMDLPPSLKRCPANEGTDVKSSLEKPAASDDIATSETSSATSASPAPPPASSSTAYPYFSHAPNASELASPFYGSYSTAVSIKTDSKSKHKCPGECFASLQATICFFPQSIQSNVIITFC